jgi:hypothetical protein
MSYSITGDGSQIASVKWYINKIGSPSGNVTFNLYAHSGTWGSTGIPTGSVLATVSVAASTLQADTLRLDTFTFTSPYTLVNGTHYVITAEYNGGNGSNYVSVGGDTSSPSHAGNSSIIYSATWFEVATEDMIFYAISN